MGIELVIEKCAMFILRRGKREIIEAIELPNQERIKTLGKKENFMYLRILATSGDERKNKST